MSVLNLLRQDVEEVAESVKLRMMRTGKETELYVGDDGRVLIDSVHDPRRAQELPGAWLVGVYTRKVTCEELEDDLVQRLGEIRPMRVAA